MGCLNNKVEANKLPTYQEYQENTPREMDSSTPGEHPKAIAFQIPNSEIKVKKGKPSRLNKQLYIIRQVSNANHQLVESPLKQPSNREKTIENFPQAEQLQFQPVQITSRKRTKTTKELSTGSNKEEEQFDNKTKTANLKPDDPAPIEMAHHLPKRTRPKPLDIQSNRSQSKSQFSHRYNDQVESGEGPRQKKRKGSLSVSLNGGQEYTSHSVHFKRVRTLHGEDGLVHLIKQPSINKGLTDARSNPQLFSQPKIGVTDFQAEINQIIQKQGEESPKLLQLFYELSLSYEKKGQLKEAITANSKYLRLARKLSGVDSCSYGAGLSHLSSINYALQNYEKAIESSMKAKSIKSYAAVESHMHKARVLNQIGLIELEQNHLKEATHYLQEVREIHAKVAKELNLRLQTMIPEPSALPSKNQYYDKAVQSMEIALNICMRVFGQNNLQTANHLDDLGTSYCDARRYKESLECFERCFSIIGCMRLTKHKDYEAHSKHFFYNLQVIRLNPSCKKEAIAKAVDILQKYFPENSLLPDLKSKISTKGISENIS